MTKILESLTLTVIAGVVLTVIMAFVTDALISQPAPNLPGGFGFVPDQAHQHTLV